jgi:hypothetical protein
MNTVHTLLAATSLSVLAACGGGGGGTGDGTVGGAFTPASGVVSGSVTKGPVNGARVSAYAISGGQMGAQVGTASTDANGNFSINIGSHAGALMLQASGGSYTDEATGAAMSMGVGDVMSAVMPGIVAGTTHAGVQVTPLTAMAQSMASHMAGGMTDDHITAANAAMGSYFSVADILHTPPMNPLVTGSSSGASQDARNYGMTLAAMSQYAKGQGMANSSAMITAMIDDASDGIMDGKRGSGPISMPTGGIGGGGMGGGMMSAAAGSGGLATAMSSFMGSALNRSGMHPEDMTELLQKLAHSDGHL